MKLSSTQLRLIRFHSCVVGIVNPFVALMCVSALLLGTGLVVFASALSETLLETTQYRKEPPSGPIYDYRYGWCFFTAGAAFIMTKMAAVFSLSGYLNRFSSVDEMVKPFNLNSLYTTLLYNMS